jgi:hypothetical protein
VFDSLLEDELEFSVEMLDSLLEEDDETDESSIGHGSLVLPMKIFSWESP